jgi:hypothetical protein
MSAALALKYEIQDFDDAAQAASTHGEPSVEWARENPDKLLRLLYVSPQSCAAVDELLGLN